MDDLDRVLARMATTRGRGTDNLGPRDVAALPTLARAELVQILADAEEAGSSPGSSCSQSSG